MIRKDCEHINQKKIGPRMFIWVCKRTTKQTNPPLEGKCANCKDYKKFKLGWEKQ